MNNGINDNQLSLTNINTRSKLAIEAKTLERT
jgi:hypothetical protein